MTADLRGKTALVTGATRGIGAAIAAKLASCGARVTVTGTKHPGKLPEGFGFIAADFADSEAVERLVKEVAKQEFDILVNNAGINKIGPFADYSTTDFLRIQKINIEVPFRLCKAALPSMRRKGSGRIVNVSSIFGKISKEFRAAYSVSKFGLDGMTLALAAEVAPYGIVANCVAPGFINTELARSILSPDESAALAARVPMQRFGQPEEVAALVTWLCGPENTYLTGQNIAIDGGFSRV